MAWPMPPTGPWAPGMSTDAKTESYTAEQWMAFQQQNWQQWAQWQQQYATWHAQYGNKNSEQFQAIQTGAMPPLPPANTAPPPAPPPPDKPPPPPHENNQPLYSNTSHKSMPVKTPGQKSIPNISTDITGNNQNRTHVTDVCPENSNNSEALKTLAEEQKAFDIQFQQWEEEFEKWKLANINHPDKKAYKEYERTFEACKARLLERRLQMKQKRVNLLKNTPQVTTKSCHNETPAVQPPMHNKGSSNYISSEQSTYPPQNYNNNISQHIQCNKMMQNFYRDNNTKNYEPQDWQEPYRNSNTNNITVSSHLTTTEPFLPPSERPKGIPGLDLVPEIDKYTKKSYEVIDITDEPLEIHYRSDHQQPDYTKISNGINNILGDEKIMNILSMVRGEVHPQSIPTNNLPSNLPNDITKNNQDLYGIMDSGNDCSNYLGSNDAYDDNYEMDQNMPHLTQHNDYVMHQENNHVNKFETQPPRPYNDRLGGVHQNQYIDRNQHNNQGRLPHPGMQQNVKPHVPLQSLLEPIKTQNDYASERFDTVAMENELTPPPNVGNGQNVSIRPPPPMRPKWLGDPLFAPSIIVEYEHKPLRLKARDFMEPVHTFDYNHQSKDNDVRKRDFEREADELFVRLPRYSEREDRYSSDKHSKQLYYRNNERTLNRDEAHPRGFRDEFDDRRKFDDDNKDRRFEDRRRDDRDKYYRREDLYRERDREEMFKDRERDLDRIRARERGIDRSRDRDRERGVEQSRERDRDIHRDRHREIRRSRSRDKDYRKRGHSKESEQSNTCSKKIKESTLSITSMENPKHIIMIDDILESPGRQMRPNKIVIILRGPPGSGKSYLAKLIRDREAEQGGTVRVMSIDDYFMQEGEIEEKDPATGKIIKKPSLKYEYDEHLEEAYITSLKKAFKRSLTDGFFTFIIYDAVNDQLKSYADIWNFSRQNGFQVYVCTMEMDPHTCFKRNIHNRTLDDIEVVCSRFFPTPNHHIQLDATTLLQSASIPDVQMEDADDDVTMEDAEDPEVNSSFTSKWEKMDDAVQLARLDGTSKPLRSSQVSMEDYLQLDNWKPNASKPGKKTVRWADIEERRKQEKMRAIGFVVGQTDWNRMTDPTMGSSALTQTKYIERVRRS